MPSWLTLAIAIAAVVAIFGTTTAGRSLVASLGIDSWLGKGPPREDRKFLLRICGGDRRRVAQLLHAERQKNPAMTEAQVYRRAIRTYMNSRPNPGAEGLER